MKIGLRFKLVALLILVAMIPLLAAVTMIVVGMTQLRGQFMGETILSLATTEAQARRVSFVKDVEKMRLLLEEEGVGPFLDAQTTRRSDEELKKLDEAWPTLSLTQEPMRTVLSNPLAKILLRLKNEDSRVAEIFLTDRFGQLVAATGRTDDFNQADESWWQDAWNDGQGRIVLAPAEQNPVTKVFTINLCVPVGSPGHLLGVARLELDVARWMETLGWPTPDLSVRTLLVRSDGTIVYRKGMTPLSEKMPDWQGDITRGTVSLWRQSGNEIQAIAPVLMPTSIGEFPVAAPTGLIVKYVRRSDLMHPVYYWSKITLAIGLAIVAVIFIGGLVLVDRGIVRRILKLEDAARQVGQGDLTWRLARRSIARWVGQDEIDDLTKDFNSMVEQVQLSYEALRNSNRLKASFIKIAGHELRTPVSYILGMARLLKDSQDADKLSHAVQTMGANAKRLDKIIQAMFKLMAEQEYGGTLRYQDLAVSELMEEVYLDCFPFVEKRGQRLIFSTPPDLPLIQADRDKLRDVVENLVMNAIKFTPDGGQVTVDTALQSGGSVTISVRDQGPGIPEHDLSQLFQPFYTGGDVMQHSSGDSAYQKRGLGLGLAVVKNFVQLHGGTVTVTSSPEGCTFTVSLPIQRPPQSVVRTNPGEGKPQ